MNEYISVNRHKIIFNFKWITILLTTIWTIYLLKLNSEDISLDFKLILIGYCMATIILPLFTVLILSIQDLIEFVRINKILSNNPFNQFLNIGFEKSYTEKKAKWTSSKPMLTGTLDNYPIRCEVENGIVRIIATANLDEIKKTDMKNWKELFGDDNITYDWFGVALVYRPKKFKQLTFMDIETELRKFIKILADTRISPLESYGSR